MHLVQAGIVSAEDLDRCVRAGLGLRWLSSGPSRRWTSMRRSDYAAKFGGGYQALGAQLRTADPWRPETIREIERELRQRYGTHEHVERRLWRDRMVLRLRQLVGSCDPIRSHDL
jgi:hypothetical protein